MQNNTYTVGQVNRYIAGMFADDLLLKRISVKGEVGTCTYTSQGHVYFSLKDNDSQISAVIWRSRTLAGLKFKLETGMKVVVTGNVEVHERDGRYQIIATEIVKEGLGDIYERFEDIVGVSFYADRPVEHILCWVSDSSKGYVDTKPIHGSYTPLKGEAEEQLCNEYPQLQGGLFFTLDCINNYELIRELCSYGKELLVLRSDGKIADDVRKRVCEMIEQYQKVEI